MCNFAVTSLVLLLIIIIMLSSYDEFIEDLKLAGWNVLHDNPGSDFGDWEQSLVEEYPTEIIDALGTDPEEVYSQLADWWESMEFCDEITEICCSFKNWSEYFVNEHAVELYDMLVDAKSDLRLSGGFSLSR